MQQDKKSTIRPTKKQRELLGYIETFIKEHGYSPSYREIMQGCNYSSVATVALHVNNLIKRGHLQKRDHSARSLEVVFMEDEPKVRSTQISEAQEKWLVKQVEHFFVEAEQMSAPPQSQVDQLYVLIGALKVLGLDGAAQSFMPRLSSIKKPEVKS
jgi:repressor LexA